MPKLPLSIYLLKEDRVSAFENDLHVNAETTLPLAAPLDGYVLPLPLNQTTPQWVGVLNSALQDPTALSLRHGGLGGRSKTSVAGVGEVSELSG